MNSMTGYGSSQFKGREVELDVHVKSVNGRFLEVRFHLPKEHAPFEGELKRAFAGWHRGTIDVFVHRRVIRRQARPTVRVNEAIAKHWAEELRTLRRRLKLDGEPTLNDILHLPQVLEHEERPALANGEIAQLERQVSKAAGLCRRLRASEGVRLRKDLNQHIKDLEARVVQMRGWREEALESARTRLGARLDAIGSAPLPPERLAVETALVIDKMDVHEETVRLSEHLKACRALIRTGGPVGKKLDFYCQELLREVNTVGSKSQLASLTQVVVNAKSSIEKFREQVQNIE